MIPCFFYNLLSESFRICQILTDTYSNLELFKAPAEVLSVGHADAQGCHSGADAEEAEAGEAEVQAAIGLQVRRDRQGSAIFINFHLLF